MSCLKIPPQIPVYGNQEFRGKCPKESLEQITFVNTVRREYPDTFGVLVVHAKNEQKLINGQFSALTRDRAMGMAVGCPDIQIPGNPSFCMELKRKDKTQSKISEPQINYLLAAQKQGAFCCVALGYNGAMEAFNEWLKLNNIPR